MAYQPRHDLQFAYTPGGSQYFVLYSEPPGVGPGIAFNGGQILTVHKTVDGKPATGGSPYVREWVQRLEPCDPDALHVALVGSKDAAALWQPCVYDDPQSPSAVGGDGCGCRQSFHDPVTWMPVAAEHYRTVSGNHENWRYYTCTALEFPEGERLTTLIIDSDRIWMRNQDGILNFLPEAAGAGYGTGYSGGGPSELARMIEKIVRQDGYDVTPGTPPGMPDRKVFAWVSSPAAKTRRELSLDQLKVLCRTGQIG
jgi:hypothetical protein